MALRELRVRRSQVRLPEFIPADVAGAPTLTHVGIHNSANRNAGDTLLFPVVRRAFDHVLGPFNWKLRQVWEALEASDAAALNQAGEGVVLGGGGLLLRDQAGSDVSRSGWQWNASIDAVRAIDVPLAIFAIGYNRFRGQPDFDPVFTDHIRAVVERAAFFGLRNSGSIKALSRYLPEELAAKLSRQYCPTTVLWQLYPEYRAKAEENEARGRRVFSFNAAFDRSDMRFGERAPEILARIATAVRRAQNRGWEIIVTAHKEADRQIEPYLEAAGVSFDTEDLTDACAEDVIDFYSGVDFAFGMRGHAQMIPFGLRRPIMSIISHDKMRFLLEDIERLDWGVEVDATDIVERLDERLAEAESTPARLKESIANAQQRVWEETEQNLLSFGRRHLSLPRDS